MIEQIKYYEKQIKIENININFNTIDKTKYELCGILLKIFNHYEFKEYFECTELNLINFILEIKDLYLDNPYHNFNHAVDVCIMIFYFLNNSIKYSSPLLLLISGLCHDIGHPGVNNLYMINSKSELAKEYNNESILENYSINLCIDLLEKYELITKINIDDLADIILATDISLHFELVQNINESNIDLDDKLIGKLILHAADISNPLRPWSICKMWSDLVVKEFFLQGDLESMKNMPISTNMDRKSTNQIQIALDFDFYIVEPFFNLLAKYFSNLDSLLTNLNENRSKWNSLNDTNNSYKLNNNKRVSFPAGTISIPDFWLDEEKRSSFNFIKKRPVSYYTNRKRHGLAPDKMNMLNNLLKCSLIDENIEF